MTRVVESVPKGAIIADTIAVIPHANAVRMKTEGVHGVMRYLETLTPTEVDGILKAGLGLHVLSYADDFNGAKIVAELRACGILQGTSVEDDLESYHLGAPKCATDLRACARTRIAAGYTDPVLYVGADQPLNGAMLGELPHTGYHKSPSYVPMPVFAGINRGWVAVQKLPFNQTRGGIQVDLSEATEDPLGRRLRWMVER